MALASRGPRASSEREGSRTRDSADVYLATNLRRNFVALALDFGFFGLAMSFASTATILPALAERLGGPNLVIGSLPSLALLGRSLPALFSARLVESRPRKLPIVLTYTLWERLPWLALALVVYGFSESNPSLVLGFLVATLMLVSMVGGALSPAWSDLVAVVIPGGYRGRFFAVGSAVSTGLGLAGALLSGFLLRSYGFPGGFALCLGAAFLLLMVSYAVMALTREPSAEGAPATPDWRSHLDRLPAIVRGNPAFAWHLAGRALTALAMMSIGFYTVHALRALGAEEWHAASFTFALLASQAVSGLVLGSLADRSGHRVVLLLGSLAAGGASLAALAVGDLLLYHAVFLLLGLSLASTNVASLTMVMEMAGGPDRPTYLGLATTAQAPFALAAPLLAGFLADRAGLGAVFAAGTLFSLGAAAVYLWGVGGAGRPRPNGITAGPCGGGAVRCPGR